MSISPNSNGAPRTVTYKISAPGKSWDVTDDGTHGITFIGGQVRDLAGNVASGGQLGTFAVNIPTPPTTAPLLVPISDTGVGDEDDLTNLNNSSPAQALKFEVNNLPGATVMVYADGTLIGTADSISQVTIVTTDGATALTDGPHVLTVRQQPPGENPSPDSAPLAITIDTTPPVVAGVVLNDVTTSGGATYIFTVTFSDANGIAIATVGPGGFVVTGPNGFNETPLMTTVDTQGNGSPKTFTFTIAADNNAWAMTDNGQYTVILLGRKRFGMRQATPPSAEYWGHLTSVFRRAREPRAARRSPRIKAHQFIWHAVAQHRLFGSTGILPVSFRAVRLSVVGWA